MKKNYEMPIVDIHNINDVETATPTTSADINWWPNLVGGEEA